MNSGEGLKFAAKNKSGQQVGNLLFKDPKPNKNKKFGYKKRAQSFPVRKVGAAQDSEAENKPATQKKVVPDRSGSQKNRSTNPRDAEPKPGRKTNNPGAEQETRKQGKDFVRKNVQRVTGKAKDEGAIDRNTVTLTQDQLNAILKSIGQVAGRDNVASIAIENGDVKVNTAEKDTPPEKGDEAKQKEEDSTTTNENRVTSAAASENILSLLAKSNKKNEKFPTSTPSSKPPTPSKTPASITNTTTLPKEDAKEKAPRKEEETTGENKKDSHQTDFKELEFANLSLAERKRRIWKQELDEQVALKRQQVEQEKYVRDVASRMGGPQYGAATRSQYEGHAAPSRQAIQNDELRKSTENFSPDSSPRGVAPSSLGVIATQRAVPAAMRASFLIGGQGSVSDYNAQLKKRQQQEWLQELEQQRIEAEQRKRNDKQRQRESDSDLTHQWAEPVNPPKTQQTTQGHQGRVRDDTALIGRGSEREAVSERQEVVEQPRSAPPQGGDAPGESGSLTNRSEERSHIRANNMLVDPAEMERREIKKQKHMEHMLAVKAQVEEKQRLKREADERRRREEAEQEMRIIQQRENLQHQFDLDKNKKRKKEEEEAARQKALADSMQTAYQEAQQEKHQKRMDKLGRMGHDTSNLRRSWDNQNGSPEGHPQQHIPQAAYKTAYQASPRMQQPTEPQPVRHSPPAPAAYHVNDQVTHHVTHQVGHQVAHQVAHQVTEAPVMVDAFTSPVYDQAVQTEFHFPPNGDISLQTVQMGRERSAGIEYKPGRKQAKGEPGKGKKSDRTQVEKTKERRTRTVREEPQQVKNKRQTQRTSRASSPGSEQDYTRNKPVEVVERPVWGASTKNKKLQRNSDKDLTVSKKKRDERRKQRAADLLAEQERNAPVRLTKTKRPKSPVEDTRREKPIRGTKPATSRAVSSATTNEGRNHEGRTDSVRDRADSQPRTDRRSYLPDTPPLKNGDFVPFMRTDEPVMSEDSVPVTPESRQMQRQRKIVKTIVADDAPRHHQGREEIRKISVQTEKDPLLNPERLKDSEQRQERILQQLSHLRQGLMMKQREMELGLSSPVTM
ncbi:uncharacterized protein [Asterias amurensis]|uniref:uncharacterized protein n=1 Tax=Asterias amurensis TaxID=7602 RepID=UPI003AB7EC89